MKGSDLFDALKKKFNAPSVYSFKENLGISNPNSYESRELSAAIIAGFVRRAYEKGETVGQKEAQKNFLRTVVEFFPINKCKSRGEAKWELFSKSKDQYLRGLYEELSSTKCGIYVFFDSRGRAIYVGRTEKQDIWTRMLQTFNAKSRGDAIYRVRHPKTSVAYKRSDEKKRKIKTAQVPIHELAHYFSAYAVDKNILQAVEGLLIRTSANDLLNSKMENV